MTSPTTTQAPPQRGWRPGPLELLTAGLLVLILAQGRLVELFASPAWQAGATVFVSIVVQAMPFLVLGVVLSGAITAYVPPEFFARVLPSRPALAVPVAGASGVLIPGCECASVPVAGGLMSRGVAPAAALAFLLSSPAINPVVIVSTFVAFPNNHEMAFARLGASLVTAVLMGWIWLRFGKGEWLRVPSRDHLVGDSRFQTFRRTATHDFLHAGGFLVIGGLTAAVLNVVVPTEWLQAVADKPVLSVLALAALAVVLSICSEADAFVAASLTQFSLTARLAFLVVGPMVDIKLFALQAGTFGRRFAVRFAPTTFVVAVVVASLVGWWLW
ncbi:MAG: permease [Candidatus Nanopelagicales bacterium]